MLHVSPALASHGVCVAVSALSLASALHFAQHKCTQGSSGRFLGTPGTRIARTSWLPSLLPPSRAETEPAALPRIGGATQPRASLPRLSPRSPQTQPISLLSRHSPQPPQPRAPLRGQPWKPASTTSALQSAMPDNITDLNGEPLAMNAAVSLALTIAAMGPATPKPKTSGNLASPKPQPPPAKAPSNLTEEEQQERDRAFEREHREDGHKISAHFAAKKASQPQEASPAKTQPSSSTAAQPDNQPSDAASDVSDMRAEMAAMQASFQHQLQEQMAAMMALLQQQQQQQPSAAEQTAAKAKPFSKAPAPAFLDPELTTAEEPPAHTEQTQRSPRSLTRMSSTRSHGRCSVQPSRSPPGV